MTNKIGQVKWVYVEAMDHRREGRQHPVLVMGEENGQLWGFAFSKTQCHEYAGQQKGWVLFGGQLSYPAFNKGVQRFDAADFGGEVKAVVGKKVRNEVKVEWSRFCKRFGEG